MNKLESLQKVFFKEIRNNLPDHISLVTQVSETLHIGTDSAYRRIRGQKQLSFDELEILVRRFNVSIDALILNSSEVVACHYEPGSKSESPVEMHLNNFKNIIKEINSFDEKKIFFEAKDISIPNLLLVPEIFAFKKFFWSKILYSIPIYEEKKFSASIIDEPEQKFCNETLAGLVKIPSVEIWNIATIDTLLCQIKYCFQKGFFENKDELENLINKLNEWVLLLKEQCVLGYRSIPGTNIKGRMDTFSLYCAEIIFPTNNILIKKGNIKAAYLVQHDVSMMLTDHQIFCNDMDEWLQTCTANANIINRKNPVEFNRFFDQLTRKINQMSEELT